MKRLWSVGVCAALLTGCVALPEQNHALGLTRSAAGRERARMVEAPTPLARPVVVLNGYRGLPTLASRVSRKLREMTSGRAEDFLAVSYWTRTDLDAIASEVVRRVDEAWPSDDPERTIEVDVVGISMGGLVARWAAMAPDQRVRIGQVGPRATSPGHKRLRIARLYTIASPHRGAAMANLVAPDAAARDMRTGSSFMAALDGALPGSGYDLVCYAQTNDKMVGALHAAPWGATPIWCSGTWAFSHFMAADNPMFLADIARRLRGEEPILKVGAPPPVD